MDNSRKYKCLTCGHKRDMTKIDFARSGMKAQSKNLSGLLWIGAKSPLDHSKGERYLHCPKCNTAEKHIHIKEDINPAIPTTAPNTSLGIQAGPIQIGKKQKGGKQGSQRPPMDTQTIMAGDNTDGELVETLGSSATAGDWIHDFVHSKNPKFEGKSKKERIKMALGAYYHKEQLEEGTTGATRMDIQKAYNHTFIHAPGWTVAQRTAHVEKHHQVKDVQVNSYGDVVNYKHLHEAQVHDDSVNVGDFIHAGFGTRGGAGLHGHVTKIDGNTLHVKGTDKVRTIGGALEHKTYKVHKKVVTLLKAGGLGEDVIVSIEDLQPILENYADWHEAMEKKGREGSEVAFKIKNAGGRTEAHLGGKKIGHYDHTTRKGHVAEARKVVPQLSDEENFKKSGSMAHKGYMIHKHSYDGAGARIEKDGQHIGYAKDFHDAKHIIDTHLTNESVNEDAIFEAGRASKNNMKRKYLGKTRGTTATGKPAHEVVIDPVIKVDDTKGKARY